ncbi:MAG: hypothetical protein Q8P51_09965 [Ignavibacteria bacterium]|nr:hypothetical protein [Ignavibacteria bacterium]
MGPLTYYSVEVKLEVRHKMLIAAQTEAEAVSAAFNEYVPIENLDDFDRGLIRTVQMKERVYVS